MKKLLLSALILSGLSSNAQFWTPKATGFTTVSRGIGSISIPDANNIWVTATDGSTAASTTVKEISRSTDGGNTWTASTIALGVGSSGLGIGSVCAISGTTAWISANPGTSGVGGVWKTTDSGATFIKQGSAAFAADSFTNFVYFWDANNGIAQGDPQGGYFEIWTTSNGGTTWTRTPSANIPAPLSASEYGYTDNYFVSGNTIWFGTSLGRLYKSTNFGLNWTVSQTPLTDFGSTGASGNCDFSSTTNGLLVSSAGALYSTTNGGTTFTPIATSGFFSGDICYVPGTTGTYVSTGTTGSSYTTNSGLTWTTIDAIQHTKVEFLNGTVGFSGGFTTSPTAGGIFKYTGTVLKTDSFVSNKFTSYPNPANDLVTITNSDNILFSEITITDLNGRTVKNFKVSDLSETQINVSELTTGVYFMNITTDEGVAVKKFVKN